MIDPTTWRTLAWVAVFATITLVQVAVATGGKMSFSDPPEGYLHLQAEAFLAGQLHLVQGPSPDLLALEDPYDVAKNFNLRMPDAILYEGRYYLYWGPVVAALNAVLWRVLGYELPASIFMLSFVTGAGCLFFLIARELQRALFPTVSAAWAMAAAAAFMVGGGHFLLLSRLIVHHFAAAAGGFFILAAIWCLLTGLLRQRYHNARILLGGTCLGLAMGSRVTLVAYVVAVSLVLFIRAVVRSSPRNRADFLLVLFPAATAVLLLLSYNMVRFGSPLEFGLRYMLTGLPGNPNDGSLLYVPKQFGLYVLSYPIWSPFFPFSEVGFRAPFLDGPGDNTDSRAASLFIMAPLTILSPIAIVAITRMRSSCELIRVIVTSLALGSLGTLAGLMMFYWSAARYLEDVIPGMSVLGSVGLFALADRVAQLRPMMRVMKSVAFLLVSFSVFVSLVVALPHFQVGHPNSYSRMGFMLDRMVGSVVQKAIPESWPEIYLSNRNTGRPRGMFYPESAPVTFDIPVDVEQFSLRLTSLVELPVGLILDVDGETIVPAPLRMGSQLIDFQLPRSSVARKGVARFRMPQELLVPAGTLLPIQVSEIVAKSRADSPIK